MDYQIVRDNEKKIAECLASIEIWKGRCRYDGNVIMMYSLIKDAYKQIAEAAEILAECYAQGHDELVIGEQNDPENR